MKKISFVMSIVGILMLSGCAESIKVEKYTPPIASLDEKFSPTLLPWNLQFKYAVGASGSFYYKLYSGTQLLGTTQAYTEDPSLKERLKVPGRVYPLGALHDKVVFVWQNSYSEYYLSVYDISKNRTYHLLGANDEFSILKKGDIYVLKDFTNRRYIHLKSLRQVSMPHESSYKVVPLRWFGYDIKNSRRVISKEYKVLTPEKAWLNIISSEKKTNHVAEPLMIGSSIMTKVAY